MARKSASDHLEKEFFNVTLAVLGIIQGLSLNQVAAKFASGEAAVINSASILGYAHFIMCFVIVLRVFQTYLLAALDYSGWKASIFEIFTIFFVGIVEYWVFDALSSYQTIDYYSLHTRIAVLFLIASASHLMALLRIRSGSLTQESKMIKRETKIQMFNFILPLIAAILCYSCVYFQFNRELGAAISLIVSAATVANIITSLRFTMVPDADGQVEKEVVP